MTEMQSSITEHCAKCGELQSLNDIKDAWICKENCGQSYIHALKFQENVIERLKAQVAGLVGAMLQAEAQMRLKGKTNADTIELKTLSDGLDTVPSEYLEQRRREEDCINALKMIVKCLEVQADLGVGTTYVQIADTNEYRADDAFIRGIKAVEALSGEGE